MNIRTMLLNDYPQVKHLWNECELSEEPEDGKDDIDFLLQSQQATGFVAQNTGHIVGAVLCGSDGRYGYIHHLAVSKTMRKKGIGKSLVDECIRFLKHRHIVIMVRQDNDIGIEFWNHLKFKNADWVKVQFFMT